MFGNLAQTQANPLLGWNDGSEEASPMLEDQMFVGWRANVIGLVGLGTRS